MMIQKHIQTNTTQFLSRFFCNQQSTIAKAAFTFIESTKDAGNESLLSFLMLIILSLKFINQFDTPYPSDPNNTKISFLYYSLFLLQNQSSSKQLNYLSFRNPGIPVQQILLFLLFQSFKKTIGSLMLKRFISYRAPEDVLLTVEFKGHLFLLFTIATSQNSSKILWICYLIQKNTYFIRSSQLFDLNFNSFIILFRYLNIPFYHIQELHFDEVDQGQIFIFFIQGEIIQGDQFFLLYLQYQQLGNSNGLFQYPLQIVDIVIDDYNQVLFEQSQFHINIQSFYLQLVRFQYILTRLLLVQKQYLLQRILINGTLYCILEMIIIFIIIKLDFIKIIFKFKSDLKMIILKVLFLLFTLTSSQVCLSFQNNKCTNCNDGYCLSTVNQTCIICSIIPNCKLCTWDTNNFTKCLVCLDSFTLINNNCYYCPIGQYFNTNINQCVVGNITNCKYYTFQPNFMCNQCLQGYFYNNIACVNSNLDMNILSDLTIAANIQILTSFVQSIIFPDLKISIKKSSDLSKVCLNNNFVCLCSNIISMDSRCNAIANLSILYTIYKLFNASITIDNSNIILYKYTIEAYSNNQSQTIAILKNIANIAFSPNNLTSILSLSWSILDIFSKLTYSISDYQQLLINLNMIRDNLTSALNPQVFNQIILQGNGWIYKYNTYFNQNNSTTNYTKLNINYSSPMNITVNQYMIFDRNLTNYPLSGILFITDTNNNLQNIKAVTFPAINSLNYYDTIKLVSYEKSLISTNLNTTQILFKINNSGNYYYVSNIQTTGIFSINVSTSGSTDPYALIRIQNMFYQTAVFYIIFFIILYLILIPLFLLIDFVDATKNKPHIKQRQPTQQGLHPDPRQDPQRDQVVRLNYKHYLPLYAIAATTNRLSRLMKLTLFLLNTQNNVTFLTLLFYAVPKQALYAILVIIPAYLMNILLGYMFGSIKISIPGYWKFILNILIPGYWAIWYQIMARLSMEFQYYLLIFVIVCIILDFLFDLLETMIMYFVLRQKNDTYQCISKILYQRGYLQDFRPAIQN